MIQKSVQIFLASAALTISGAAGAQEAPHLRKQGTATQLIVDGKPFLILGGELGNSSSSDLKYLNKLWPTLKTIGLNTVIGTLEWDMIEPREGVFDFSSVDGMIKQAEAANMKLAVLWLAVWKNSTSSYAPAHIKRNWQTYARAQDDKGVPQDILSAFDPDTLRADKRAFAALMDHLKKFDKNHTMVMVQIENEVGMLPVVRDYSPQAQAAFQGQVPNGLLSYLQANRATLHPYVRDVWASKGNKTAGSWQEVFGDSTDAQQIFQAWGYAVFLNELAVAGKAAYDLPMWINSALNSPTQQPGQYPSGGPLPHLFDIWKASAPAIEIVGMDIYYPNFNHWVDQFKRPDNPVFVPEANRSGQPDAGANAFYVFGELDGIGFSPFHIETLPNPETNVLTDAYRVLHQITPAILANQGKGTMRGFRAPISYEGELDETPRAFDLGGYSLRVSMVDSRTPKDTQDIRAHGGLIIQTGEDEFLVAGRGVIIRFADADAKSGYRVGLEQIVEGEFAGGKWVPGRWLNGDENGQGRYLRLPPEKYSIQKLKVYRYK